MAKFIKSIFQTSEKTKSTRYDSDSDDNDLSANVMDSSKRKLSISRSGRMKQNNKKRSTLSTDLYGEDYQPDKITTKEYHVNKNTVRHKTTEVESKRTEKGDKRPSNIEIKSAEEEIDSAFQVIDKT